MAADPYPRKSTLSAPECLRVLWLRTLCSRKLTLWGFECMRELRRKQNQFHFGFGIHFAPEPEKLQKINTYSFFSFLFKIGSCPFSIYWVQ